MNSINELCRLASERFTDLDIKVDPPSDASGSWFVDLKRGEQLVTVQWQKSRGFGLSCRQESGYGEGPDELYPNVESCFARVVSLLLLRD